MTKHKWKIYNVFWPDGSLKFGWWKYTCLYCNTSLITNWITEPDMDKYFHNFKEPAHCEDSIVKKIIGS